MSSPGVNQPRRHRDTEILCVFVSLWLILSVLSASSVSISRTRLHFCASSDRRRRGGMGDECGQLDYEGAPLAIAITERLHRASMHFDDVTDERQAETEAAMDPRGRAVRLPEALEHAMEDRWV